MLVILRTKENYSLKSGFDNGVWYVQNSFEDKKIVLRVVLRLDFVSTVVATTK